MFFKPINRSMVAALFSLWSFAIPCAQAQEVVAAPEFDLLPLEQPANVAPSVYAQPLAKVLRHSFYTNPALNAAKADIKGVTETLALALSNYRPVVTADASATVQKTEPSTFGSPNKHQQNVGLSISQPIYRGGRTMAAVRAADNQILSSRAYFDSLVQDVFLNIVISYLNVLENEEVLALRQNNETVLETQLEANSARFELGDRTLTDVSQAKSRLAAAKAERVAASASLRSAHAVFERLTGLEPKGLITPESSFEFIGSLDDLITTAHNVHPDIRAAEFQTNVSDAQSREILGELLPEVSLNGNVSRSYNPTFGNVDYIDTSRLTLDANIPLYLGGATRARYRQAQYNTLSDQYETMDVARDVERYVIESWEALQAAKARVEARQLQVEASRLAFEGVTEESRFGSRTTLDVLDAEQERLNAEVDLVSAEFDEIEARYTVLAATGQLTPILFGIDDITAEMDQYYEKTRHNWFGLDIEPNK